MEQRRPDIQGLRGIAVLAVLFHHAHLPGFDGGFVGVDVFFVISGFVITKIIHDEIGRTGRLDIPKFMAGRACRLAPALIATLALTLVAGLLIYAPFDLSALSVSVVFSAAGISNFLYWSQAGYFDTSAVFKPLLHTWSLGVEQQFYVFWPFALLLLTRFPRNVGLVLLLAIGLASFLLNLAYDDDGVSIFFLPWFRVFEFSFGALAFWLPAFRSAAASAVMGALGAGLVAYAVLVLDPSVTFPSTAALIPCAGAALLIFAGVRTPTGRALAVRPLVWVGDISYSLYLAHWPVLTFWQYARFDQLSALDRVMAIAVSFALAWLMYRFVEVPTHLERKKRGQSVRSVLSGSAAAALCVAGASGLVWASNGWPARAGIAREAYPALVSIGEVAFRKEYYGGVGTEPRFAQGPQPASVMIAGDSHARQFFTGLTSILPTDRGLEVFDQGSCIFRVRRCEEFDGAVRDFLGSKPGGVLFVSQRWDFDKHIVLHLGLDRAGNVTPADLAEFYAGRIAALFDIYRLAGNQPLFIVGSSPEVVTFGDVATCLLRPAYFSAPELCKSSDERQPEIAFRREFNRLLAARIAELNRLNGWSIRFDDPFEVLCAEGRCAQVRDGEILYNDNDHLSVAGSRLVISRFSREILASLP